MPGYLTKQERIAITGAQDLIIESLLDRQQYYDPLGEAERLGISSASWPLFGLTWPSGAYLAARLAIRPVNAAERILEIGCGLGLASLVGHRRGADMTASDCHPLAGLFFARNLRLNGLLPMDYRHGQWGSTVPEVVALPVPTPEILSMVVSAVLPVALLGALPVALPVASPIALPAVLPVALPIAVEGLFDLIIGSDLLYERDARGDLAHFIALHACPKAEVWIVDPNRGNRPAFTREMAQLGFGMREEKLEAPLTAHQAAYKGRFLIYTRTVGTA